MNFNNSFGDNNNLIIKPIEKGDIIEEESLKKKENLSTQNNTDNKNVIDNKNIFSALPSKIENISNNKFEHLLAKELLNYNLKNIFNIIGNKIIIIKTKIFYILKKNSEKKLILLLKSEILFLKISSSIHIISNIFKKKIANKLFHVLYTLGRGNKINNMFKIKYEIKFKNEKDNLISENTIRLKKLEKDVNDMTNNIKLLNLRENELKLKINNLSKKEKQLNESIKQIESSKSITNNKNVNTINNNSVFESDILTLESTISSFKQQKEGKKRIINNFIFKVNDLLNDYQEYIYMLNNNNGSRNVINNNININYNESNDISNSNYYSNKPSISVKGKDESSNTYNTIKTSSMK